MINFKLFCEDYNIEYAQSGSHFRPGWVNISCKFCTGHAGFHLGIKTQDGYAFCYRCGWHPLNKVIAALTGANYSVVKDIIKKYSLVSGKVTQRETRENIPSQIIFPSGTQKLTQKAKNYLTNRKFNPDKLASIWGLLSTPHFGEYKNRIFAPIYYKRQIVSYQTRAISNNKNILRYLACRQEDEIIQHQHCIYGLDQAIQHNKTVLVCEGITDVWRMGIGSVCTFGVKFSLFQARLLAKNFDRVFIMYDSEPQAQEQAEKLGFLIGSSFGNIVEVINLPFLIDEIDPGDLPQNIADEIMKEIEL